MSRGQEGWNEESNVKSIFQSLRVVEPNSCFARLVCSLLLLTPCPILHFIHSFKSSRFDRKRKSVIVNKLHESASFDHRDLSEYDEHAEEDAPLVPPDADDGSEQVRLTDASRQ